MLDQASGFLSHTTVRSFRGAQATSLLVSATCRDELCYLLRDSGGKLPTTTGTSLCSRKRSSRNQSASPWLHRGCENVVYGACATWNSPVSLPFARL